ncbi:MAG TPA: DUF4231 domain-containing protein [Thermoanaerobaculia bacterium]|nr:DUF4231 domain-containing protein [Thermoanaerobaculia bacterium]
MKSAERLEWLQREIDTLVTRYQSESARFKKEAFRLKIVSGFLAAIVTVLLGLKMQSPELLGWFSNVALILSASISVLSAYEAFFDPRALWVRETVTFARLKDLQRDLRFWAAGLEPGTIDERMLDSFKRRLDSILEDTLKYWMKIRGAPELEKGLEARAELRPKSESGPTSS